jgi:hypothetical protein
MKAVDACRTAAAINDGVPMPNIASMLMPDIALLSSCYRRNWIHDC